MLEVRMVLNLFDMDDVLLLGATRRTGRKSSGLQW
jgi:hypothetical protein